MYKKIIGTFYVLKLNISKRKLSSSDSIDWFKTIYEVSDKSTEKIYLKDFKIFKNFITANEEISLFSEIEPYLKRMRYEKNHWDDAIINYRETEKVNWKKENKSIIDRMHNFAFGSVESRKDNVLNPAHILDLADNGYIKPHVDSVKFCGSVVAGLSLLSDCVFRFVHEQDKYQWINVYLPRYSFYVMSGDIRYLFTHEVLQNELSSINGIPVRKTRRISILCRNEPNKQPLTPPIVKSLQVH